MTFDNGVPHVSTKKAILIIQKTKNLRKQNRDFKKPDEIRRESWPRVVRDDCRSSRTAVLTKNW